ncbi:zinc finger protein 239-like isoform X1 [Vespula squamosa]|uniref:Zinc finger protein 239-like isoform X1 n=1 Tax=Vespula squamosa TaxID=30214 RepID=A0ABD2AUE6_VESSQ
MKQEKPHKCNECGRSFPTPGDLRAHGYSHTGNWPMRCPICNRGFCKPGALHHHMQLHNGDRPYQCTVCDKKFSIIGNLRTHERTHHSQFSIINLRDSASVETGISRVDNARFEFLNTNALQLPSTIFPWTPWLPLQY